MAVAHVVHQREQHRRLDARGAVRRCAAGEGDGVRRGKGHAEKFVAQQVRVPAHRLGRAVAESLVELQRQGGGQVVPGQKFHQAAHARLIAETAAISRALRSVMPLRAVSRSGDSSSTSSVSSPKRETRSWAVAGPTPLTTPEDR